MPRRVSRSVAADDGTWYSHIDAAIAAVAGRQFGVIALRQLVELGLGASGVRDRVARGLLHPIHRGVFAVGHRSLTERGRWMAAVLAFERAALSHASAAALHGLRPSASPGTDVTVSRTARPRKDIRVHRSRTLLLRDVTAVDGIACTSVARTLLDLATIVERRGLERACDRAQVLRSFDLNEIGDVLDRAGGHRGAGRLRAVLAEHDIGTTETRSPLEERFLAILDAAGIRRPTADHTIDVGGEPVTVDFAWVAERVVVELDSWQYHGNPIAQARDARRSRGLGLLGWFVLRYTHVDLRDANGVECEIRSALTQPGVRLP